MLYLLISFLFICHTSSSSSSDSFLSIPLSDLCQAEPHLDICAKARSRSFSSRRGRGRGGNGLDSYSVRDRIWPGLTPKDAAYCSRMKSQFAWTCQPSKPLRVDLVEFCKDYSFICRLPNFHRLPGPRMGGNRPQGYGFGNANGGNIGVSGNFGFGLGVLPGFEVNAGWGVDVGPIPGMTQGVGVNTGIGLGLMGASQPESYRRGMGKGNDGNQGIGIGGGVGVG
ncbi:hypothetical protein PRIPAC_87580 [Pristionchus pacificus]|nr:hypothetical protein PRIPAC_87580 [Pristionchus pacificus]